MRFGLLLLAPALASCAATPSYSDPKRVAHIEQLREARDLCLIQNVSHFDDGKSDVAKVGDYVAMSCSTETAKLVELAIPAPSRYARDAFQGEAARRAAGYVITARRAEGDAVDRRRQPQPLAPTPASGPAPLQ
jgi:hypothetical protein